MKIKFWVKFQDQQPEAWTAESFNDFWHNLRERMLKYPIRLEWIICD